MSRTLSLTIWRDSVCAGDDGEAPHELSLSLPPDLSLRDVATQVVGGNYLASIAGGRATWILEGRRPLAVFAQEWTQPRFLVSPDSPLTSLVEPTAKPHLQFRYWCQWTPSEYSFVSSTENLCQTNLAESPTTAAPKQALLS